MAEISYFPGMRLSPDGKEFRLFEREEDVPRGWLRESPESFVKKGLGKKVAPVPAPKLEEKPEEKPADESLDL